MCEYTQSTPAPDKLMFKCELLSACVNIRVCMQLAYDPGAAKKASAKLNAACSYSGPNSKQVLWSKQQASALVQTTSKCSGPYNKQVLWSKQQASALVQTTSKCSGPNNKQVLWFIQQESALVQTTSKCSGPYNKQVLWSIQASKCSGPSNKQVLWSKQQASAQGLSIVNPDLNTVSHSGRDTRTVTKYALSSRSKESVASVEM